MIGDGALRSCLGQIAKVGTTEVRNHAEISLVLFRNAILNFDISFNRVNSELYSLVLKFIMRNQSADPDKAGFLLFSDRLYSHSTDFIVSYHAGLTTASPAPPSP